MFNHIIIWFLLIIASICFGQRPKLTEINHNRSQNIGTKFLIVCSVEEGIEPFQFSWKYNDKSLSSNDIINIETVDDRSILKINKIDINHSGNYTCTVSNYFGDDNQHIFLTIKGWNFFCFSVFFFNF